MRAINVPAERVAAARAALGGVRTLLLAPTPQTLNECSRPLSEAAEVLRRLKRVDQQGRESALGLKRDLDEVRSLLEQAGASYLGWARILNSVNGTYDAVGDLHAPGGATVSVEG
jgi:hypothetical protein